MNLQFEMPRIEYSLPRLSLTGKEMAKLSGTPKLWKNVNPNYHPMDDFSRDFFPQGNPARDALEEGYLRMGCPVSALDELYKSDFDDEY